MGILTTRPLPAFSRIKNTGKLGDDQLGDVRVSTLFLSLDHSHVPGGVPILWETMIFGGEHHEYQERYSSYEEAVLGHQRAVGLVTGGAS